MSQDDLQKLQADWVFTVNDVLSSLPNNYKFGQRPQVAQEKDPNPKDVPGRVCKHLRKNGQPVPMHTIKSALPNQSTPTQPNKMQDIPQTSHVGKEKSEVCKYTLN